MALFGPVPVGVDLGDSSLKVIRLKGKKVTLAAYMEVGIDIRPNESLLTGSLRDFFKSLNIDGKPAVVQIPGHLAFVRSASFPPMPGKELNEAVKWEVKRQLPFPMEEAIFDYVALDMPDGIAVTFAAIERRVILKYLSPLKDAGLNVIAVDIAPLCLIRSLPQRAEGNIIIVDIGSVSTEINIFKAGALRLTRSVEIGGDSITDMLIRDGMEPAEAGRILKNGTEEELKSPLSELLRELSRSMDYYEANFKEKNFSDIILSGGVSLNPSVRGFFSHMFDIKVSVHNPFEGYALKDETIRQMGPRFAVVMGLARRAA